MLEKRLINKTMKNNAKELRFIALKLITFLIFNHFIKLGEKMQH